MKPHRAAALVACASCGIALLFLQGLSFAGGWYLMAPPSQADADESCTGSPTISDELRGWLRGQPASHVQFERCLPETETLSTLAPLSLWREVGVYQTLSDCQGLRSFGAVDSFSGPFFAGHQEEKTGYVDWLQKQLAAESNPKDKQLDAEAEEERLKLPKEVRDLAAEYNAGKFGIDDVAQKKAAHEQEEQAFNNVVLRHRDKYPGLAAAIATQTLEDNQKQAQRCIASDDPRLRGK